METSLGSAAAYLIDRLNRYNWALTKHQLAVNTRLPADSPALTFHSGLPAEVADDLDALRREAEKAREAFRQARLRHRRPAYLLPLSDRPLVS